MDRPPWPGGHDKSRPRYSRTSRGTQSATLERLHITVGARAVVVAQFAGRDSTIITESSVRIVDITQKGTLSRRDGTVVDGAVELRLKFGDASELDVQLFLHGFEQSFHAGETVGFGLGR